MPRRFMSEIYYEKAHYAGHVQGVGFRYAALEVAREFEVAGFAKNLGDGRVLVEVEGRKGQVTEFLKTLEEKMHGYIRQVERAPAARTPEFSGFVIR